MRKENFLWVYVLQTIFLHLILIKNYDVIRKFLENKEKTVIIKKGKLHSFCNKVYKIFVSMSCVLLLNLHLNHLVKLYKEDHVASYLYKRFTEIGNIYIIIYWMALLIFSIFAIEKVCSAFSVRKILKRKCFHILIFLIYFPALKIMQYDLLLLISVLILYAFLTLEVIRNRVKNNIFDSITEFLIKNIDERDDCKFILTHTFLLSGCFSSFILDETKNLFNFENDLSNLKNADLSKINLEKFIGLVSLGIGDAFVR